MASEKPQLAPHELRARLQQFTGGGDQYRHFTGRLIYTEGVHYLAEQAGAHWLIDAIASHQIKARVAAAPFQIWKLKVHADRSATLIGAEDIDEQGRPVHARTPVDRALGRWTRGALARQAIEWTDFPLEEIKLYLQHGVLMLPSEY